MRPMDWVFFGQKFIIPEKPRPDIHESHLGMEKCRSRAISVINRPGMSADIERLVAKCSTCLKHQRSNQKEPQNLHTVPARAWQKLGTDIFEYKSKPYLVIVDYYSNIEKFVSFIKTNQEKLSLTGSEFSAEAVDIRIFCCHEWKIPK